jgi:hypothetical protein
LSFAERYSLLAFHSLPNAATSLPIQAVDARLHLTLQRRRPGPEIAAIRSVAGAFLVAAVRAIVAQKTAPSSAASVKLTTNQGLLKARCQKD